MLRTRHDHDDIDEKPVGQVACYTTDTAVYYAWIVDSASLMAIAVVSRSDAASILAWWSASGNWYPTQWVSGVRQHGRLEALRRRGEPVKFGAAQLELGRGDVLLQRVGQAHGARLEPRAPPAYVGP